MLSTADAWDTIVIGAGPAGAAAAIECARRGLRVLVIESKQFPRRKVCGGCMNRRSVGFLRGLVGASHAIWQRTVPLSEFRLLHGGKDFGASMPDGMAIDRADLDDALLNFAIDIGVEVLMPATAKVERADADRCMVSVRRGNESLTLSAATVVLACGLGHKNLVPNIDLHQIALPDSRVGIEAILDTYPDAYRHGTLTMAVGKHGYVGLTQITGERLHVAAAVDRAALQRMGPAKITAAIMGEALANKAGRAALDVEAALWRGTPPLTAQANRLASNRVFLVGDAAGYVEPFTGEGIRWALHSGIGVTPFIADASRRWVPEIAEQWEAWYRTHIRQQQLLCRRLSWGLKHSTTRWLAHLTLAARPTLANLIISRLNAESPR